MVFYATDDILAVPPFIDCPDLLLNKHGRSTLPFFQLQVLSPLIYKQGFLHFMGGY